VNIKEICESHDLDFVIHATSSIAELKEIVDRYHTAKDVVYYAAGGDGTLQALVNAVDLSHAVIQYLPFGSGNNAYVTFYGQSFDLKRDILSTDIFKADLGKVNGEYFVTMFGLALDAHIGSNLEKFRGIPVSGKVRYFISIFYTLAFDMQPIQVIMTADGQTERKVSSFISVTNGPTIGGRTPISPNSSAFDGRLNALVSDRLTRLQALKLFSKISSGTHLSSKRVSQYLFKEMVFQSDSELLYEIDGEPRKSDFIRVGVCRNSITLKGSQCADLSLSQG